MDLFSAMDISATGLSAQRTRMAVASSNMANVSTTRSEQGGPYRRRNVILRAQPIETNRLSDGFDRVVRSVTVEEIVEDTGPLQLEYDPGHPDANEDGYVAYPNINVIEEMVDMITASRAYEAGINALGSAVSMAERAIGIGR